jgi:regulator of cell morphogenesis and NO signaling
MYQGKLSEYFEADHDRLDNLFKDFQRMKRTDYPAAKESFKQFKFGLQRHIVWEEEVLFPLFENKTGMKTGGPTFVMRIEHRQIGDYLEDIHKKVQVADPESDEEEKQLLAVLAAHNQKEEHILYPAIDNIVGEADKRAAFQAMENMPQERYAVCCKSA